jgi:crotonobetainyl-CoA:carnitine CoA-transferase CaiB-like acyl-CoA transferase
MGPLADVRILEIAGAGPGPIAASLLADLGARVVRIERREAVQLGIDKGERQQNMMLRGRPAIALDLKDPRDVDTVLDFAREADGLIEGFRPGVMERLGLGPEVVRRINPRLVYGRVTGWGQTGPLAQAAGHDINYVAITGVLDAIGRRGQPPAVPLTFLGDIAGGAHYLVMGMLAAILEARGSGTGQVVDASIVDGVASMSNVFLGLQAAGRWNPERGTNLLDSGAYFYDVYECSDGRWISIGPIEARFHGELLRLLGVDPARLGEQLDPASWEANRHVLAQVFRSRTRDEWSALLEGTDTCFAPVLSFAEAPHHPQLKARATYLEVGGVTQAAPAPRFSRTVPQAPQPPEPEPRPDAGELLAAWRDRRRS